MTTAAMVQSQDTPKCLVARQYRAISRVIATPSHGESLRTNTNFTLPYSKTPTATGQLPVMATIWGRDNLHAHNQEKAFRPVIAWPMISVWISSVPSYVKTDSRLF